MKFELQIQVELTHCPFPLQSPGQRFFVRTSGITKVPFELPCSPSEVVELLVVLVLDEVAFCVSLLTTVILHREVIDSFADAVAAFMSSKI